MGYKLNTRRLGALIRAKRDDRSLRDVLPELGGISLSTLSRVENGREPDLQTLFTLCDWLGVPPADLIENTDAGATATGQAETLAVQLRASRSLAPDVAAAFATLVTAMEQHDEHEETKKGKRGTKIP